MHFGQLPADGDAFPDSILGAGKECIAISFMNFLNLMCTLHPAPFSSVFRL